MDFFGHQEQARRNTKRLIGLFALAIVAIILTLYVVLAATMKAVEEESELVRWDLLAAVAGGVLVVVGIGSLYKVSQLRQGGGFVARMLGGRRVHPNTTDELERRLINVVEEMSIASGMAVPEVFVLDGEPSINAFAAGWSPEDAAVAVTRGCLEKLDRDQLQGVIAHEFSHVFHGDMRINLRLMGVLHGITCIAVGGYILLRVGAASGGNRKKEGGAPILALAIAMLVVGYIGVFFARLIKAAVSRQREFLADAAAVQYTRNPNGLAGALKTIGGIPDQKLVSGRAEEASHMMFAHGGGSLWSNLMATHPPLQERIARIDKTFKAQRAKGASSPSQVSAVAGVSALAGNEAQPSSGDRPVAAGVPVSPAAVADSVGEPEARHFDRARAILAAIPEQLRVAAHEPYSARTLVLALLLSDQREVQDGQLDAIADDLGPDVAHETRLLFATVHALPAEARLPLVEILLPALRGMTEGQYTRFEAAVTRLIHADNEVEPFEIALHKVLQKHLGGHFHAQPSRRERKLADLSHSAAVLLTSLGKASQRTAGPLDSAAAVLGFPVPWVDDTGLDALDVALADLAAAGPAQKRQILVAATAVAAEDNIIGIEEAELLRAYAEVLECPLPPILAPESDDELD